jgi:eukaryotic-like serine/threonine-protein kinase
MTNPAASLGAVAPNVPSHVAQVVDRALAFDKNDRWPNARSMQTAVRNAYLALTGTALESAGSSSWFDPGDRASSDRPPGRRAPLTRAGTTLSVESGQSSLEGRSHPGRWLLVALLAVVGAFSFGYFGLRKTPPERLAALLGDGPLDAGARARTAASAAVAMPTQEPRTVGGSGGSDFGPAAGGQAAGGQTPITPSETHADEDETPDPTIPPRPDSTAQAWSPGATKASAPGSSRPGNAKTAPHKEPSKKAPAAKRPRHH